MTHIRYVIDEEICEKYRLEIPELLVILLLSCDKTYDDVLDNLVKRGIIEEEKTLLGKDYKITLSWYDKVMNVLADSALKADNNININRIDELAEKLQEIYPKGKKEGTNKYWRGNIRDIKLKLKKFFVKYGDKYSKYSNEEIIQATKSYVDSFNGDYIFMRTLQYFIFKDERRVGGEESSDLATILENAGQVDSNSKNDIGELV